MAVHVAKRRIWGVRMSVAVCGRMCAVVSGRCWGEAMGWVVTKRGRPPALWV